MIHTATTPRPSVLSRQAARWALASLYLCCTTASSLWSIARYRNFESGWAWDLAHVNQSFWALTHGLDRITVRPFNHYAREGPEPWRSVHFAPLRLALLPIYAVWPRPETLLVGHSAIFWLSLFGVARLARGSQESGRGEALWPLVAAGLWAATPATFLMSINDCRPLQMGVPFLFWAIAGYTERRPKLFAAAALAALAARQEYGIAIATLALVPAGPSGQYRSTWSWPAAALTLGLGWFAGYFVYLDQMFGPQAVTRYFTVPSSFARHGWLDVLGGFVATAGSLAVLAGGWSLLAVREPRYLAASLPLVTMIVERNLTRLLPGDAEWHMVRYAAIPVAWWVAGGVLALRRVVARPTTSHAGRSRGLRLSAALGVVVGWIAPSVWVQMRLAAVPAVVVAEDVQPVRQWIARIPSDAAVWCDYPFAAKLSGRARLYSYRDPPVQDTASGGPPREEWVVGDLPTLESASPLGIALRDAGFMEVFRGTRVAVIRRGAVSRQSAE